MKLRLLVTEKCHKNCPNCCNKNWDLTSLPVCTDFTPYDTIMLTGGEPLLLGVDSLLQIRNSIFQKNSSCRIILYTTASHMQSELMHMLRYMDGITLTFHDQKDVDLFSVLNDSILASFKYGDKSLRLNIFNGIDYSSLKNLFFWHVKDNIEWIENCPLPQDEVFMRL